MAEKDGDEPYTLNMDKELAGLFKTNDVIAKVPLKFQTYTVNN